MKKTVYILIFIFCLGFLENVLAWDNEKTHRDISGFAGSNSVLGIGKGDYLKTLGFTEGLSQRFKLGNAEKTAKEWLQDGAFLEDEGGYSDAVTGKARYTNHFHDPLKSWDSAGLSDLQNGESSLKWAQDSAKQSVSLGGDWTWKTVRDYFYKALTSSTDASRQENFAKTFKGLGYQMHLVQDASQPAHVRNDAHPVDGMGGVLGMMEGLETWAKKNPTKINSFASSPAFPMVSLAISYGGYVPITQFIDTNQYYGGNPSSSSGLGFAEYTNANFVSDNTIFTENKDINHKHYFPYPRYSTNSYEIYEVEHSLITKRIYLKKKGDGEQIEHFATAGPLFKFLNFDPMLQKSELKLDPVVYKDYASLLIPRAVGYSAGLLNYFFRGHMDMIPDNVKGSGYVIENNADEDMEGTFELYYDNDKDERIKVPGANWTLSIYKKSSGNNKSTNINFTPPYDAKEFCKYILVFKGRIGQEQGAIAGKIVSPERCLLGAAIKLASNVQIQFSDNKTISTDLNTPLNNRGKYPFIIRFAEGNPFIFGILSNTMKRFGEDFYYTVDLYEIDKKTLLITHKGEAKRMLNAVKLVPSLYGYNEHAYEFDAQDLFISNDGKTVNIVGAYEDSVESATMGGCKYIKSDVGYFVNESKSYFATIARSGSSISAYALNPTEIYLGYNYLRPINCRENLQGYNILDYEAAFGARVGANVISSLTRIYKPDEPDPPEVTIPYNFHKSKNFILKRDKGFSLSLMSYTLNGGISNDFDAVSFSSERGFFCEKKNILWNSLWDGTPSELLTSSGVHVSLNKLNYHSITRINFSPDFKDCSSGGNSVFSISWSNFNNTDVTVWRKNNY